jgi:hypothetical protein
MLAPIKIHIYGHIDSACRMIKKNEMQQITILQRFIFDTRIYPDSEVQQNRAIPTDNGNTGNS